MKIQLDTTAKTIKVEEDVRLEELVKVFERILPNGEWKKFKLRTNITINNWSTPIYVPYKNPTPYPYPWITWCGTDSASASVSSVSADAVCDSCTIINPDTPFTLTAGVYNIEG